MNSINREAPLAGVRVLDFGQYIAAPGAAMVFVELGAEVIKIEPPGGERARHIGEYGDAIVRSYNRGKRSITVDLRQPRGRELVMRLAGRCDVVVQNQRPGAVQKLGLGPQEMRARYPRLVYLSISGFGTLGPSRERPGFDIAAQAESGLMSVTGEPDGLPQKVGAPIIDCTAAHLGAQAVLAALFRRERTGQGASLETSLMEAAMHLQLPSFTEFLSSGVEPQRLGNAQPKNAPAADIVRTRDGMVVISAYVEEHWARLCAVMNRPDLVSDPRFCTNAERVRNRPAMRQLMNEALSHLSSEDFVARLSEAQIVVGAVRNYAQALESADIRACGLVVEASGENGSHYRTLGLPYTIDGHPRLAPTASPAAGADTETVLLDAGLSHQELDALRAEGVIL